mgnify:CR=1 FL=1
MNSNRLIYEDWVGEKVRALGPPLASLDIPEVLRNTLAEKYGGEIRLSPPQATAAELGVIREKADYLVCAPTNSGKTLIAVLRMFASAIETGGRSVYVVPLKALAEEKLSELKAISEGIDRASGPKIHISITTGDYQLTGDFLGSPPPKEGEIVICTPERLEVMLRNPENHQWARAVSTYVIDEFHLLGETGRGCTLESLITRLFATCPWSSILGLSATIGGVDDIAKWFRCNGRKLFLVESSYRFPSLHRQVLVVEDRDRYILEPARDVLADPSRSLLVFVYRKADTARLSEMLGKDLGAPDLVQYFHSGLTYVARKKLMKAYKEQGIRILVTTTSLKMGVNFPVTDVIVRDTYFHGSGRLLVRDILQMVGRAGRGDTPGMAWVLCDRQESANSYAEWLAQGMIEPIEPQLVPAARKGRTPLQKTDALQVDPVRAVILTELAARKEVSIEKVSEYLSRTYSASCGRVESSDVANHLAFLEEGKLAYRVEGAKDQYAATKLGRTVSYSGISPETGSILAGFLRALIRLDEKKRDARHESPHYLARLVDLDFLFLAVAGFETRDSWISRQTKSAQGEVQEYIERLPPEEKPLVNLWRSESSEDFPTRRLLSTLKILGTGTEKKEPEVLFYQIMRTAVLLHRHSRGRTLEELASEYKVDEGSLENGLKYTAIWLLSALAQICDSRKCYKLDPLRMRILELLEDLSFGATLGKLMTIDGIGKRTVEKLIQAGYSHIDQLLKVNKESLKSLGLTTEQTVRITSFVKRRFR